MEKTWDCSAYARAKAQREILSFSVFQKKKKFHRKENKL